MKTERQSNIELARLIAVAGVIILHYNNPSIGGGFIYAEGSSNLYALYIFESIFICAVDLFILISGYFMCESNRRELWKPVELIFQVMLFSFGIYVFRSIGNGDGFSIKGLIGSLIPANYFVILYVTLYIISPFINVIFQNITKTQFRYLVGIEFVLFSVYPTLVDVFTEITEREWNGLSTIGMHGSQGGYTIVNFILMYTIGAYLRVGNCEIKNWKTGKLVGIWIILVLCLTVWAVLDISTAWEYCNPLVIASAALVFLLFFRLKIGVNKVINRMAEGVFSIFLLHAVFIPVLRIESAVKANMLCMLCHVLGSAILISIVCLGFSVIYTSITKPLFRKLKKVIYLQDIIIGDVQRK